MAELEDHDRIAAALEDEIEAARVTRSKVEAKIGKVRRKAAPALAEQVQAHLRDLALPNAALSCEVGDDPGDDVELLVSMNAGAPLQPLAKIASGGELARTMLALRLVLSADPASMVFDEVDAGVGGAAAQAWARPSAGSVSSDRFWWSPIWPRWRPIADNQVTVVKEDDGSMVSVTANVLDTEARVVELSRMLSGSPGSDSAREHAAELLRSAWTRRRSVSTRASGAKK